MSKRPAFFLDRDGNINFDRVYINDERLMELIPGAAEAIARVRKLGYVVVVVTNQSGVGRGIIEPGALPRIHARMENLLAETPGAGIDHYEICVHRPDENCRCRKPSPFMVQNAARELDLDLSRSVFVGDRLADVATGHNAGCALSVLVRSGKGVDEEKQLRMGQASRVETPDFVADDLAGAVDWALKQLKK